MKPRARGKGGTHGRGARTSTRLSHGVAPGVRGLSLDTGVLIAFERADRAVVARLKEGLLAGRRITLPTVVLAEGWRGGERSARVAALIEACVVEPLLEAVARRAGEAVGAVRGAATIDAIVVASAATRGDVVLTSDPDDLRPLAEHLGGVGIVAI
jgi:predicted nucleic acid-binding protein